MNEDMLKEYQNILKMIRGQKLVSHKFEEENCRLFLHFETFVMQIELPEYTLFVSPIYETIKWKSVQG